jgi:hypothetical protein
MPPAVVPFQGNEILEVVQGGVNCKAPASALNQTPTYSPYEPSAAGTITNFVLPGPGNYLIDVDTAIGNIEIDGIIPQRDGQSIVFGNAGINNLSFGVGSAHGSAGNQLRANSGPIVVLPGDTLSIRIYQALGYWVVT